MKLNGGYYNGKVIRPQSPYVYLYTDASLKEWGAAIEKGEHTQDEWNYEESRLHINLLKLKAIYFALLVLCIYICIRSDSQLQLHIEIDEVVSFYPCRMKERIYGFGV